MGDSLHRDSAGRTFGLVALTFVAYVTSGWVGLRIASVANAVTLFWAPTGLSIGALLLLGRPAAVAVGLGALTLNLLVSGELAFALPAAVGNLLEALVASTLFSRWTDGRLDLARPSDAASFVLASALGCTIAALVGGLSVHATLTAADSTFMRTASLWWLGDVAGAIVFSPLLLAFAHPAGGSGASTIGRWDLGLVVCSAVSACLWFVRFANPDLGFPLTVVALASVTAAALRYGTRGGTLATAFYCLVLVPATLHGRGPFAGGDVGHRLALAWAAIAILAGTSLVVSALSSERFDAEARMRASETRLRGLFENAPEGLMLLDEDRRILLANPWIEALTGRGRLLGVDVAELLPEAAHADLEAALSGADDSGPCTFRVTLERAEDVRQLVVHVTRLGSARQLQGAVVVVEDVTMRERESDERARLEAQLAVAQRFDSIGKLAGGIAHDFNNMLQAITANLELVALSTSNGARASVPLKRAIDAADRASSLTRQLLAFSRRQPASFDQVDVIALLRSSLAMLDRLVPEDIHLVFEPKCDEAFVRGDRSQLEQVLMNLVVNARDAMPTGGELRIVVETEGIGPADAGVVRLVVTDQGAGVPPGIRDRIFEPFFTTKAVGRGTGLGLAVVYGVVQGHGGTLRVEDAKPRGARFVIELPRIVRPVVTRAHDQLAPAPLGHGERILLVEDDGMVRAAVGDMLTSAGYDVTVASHGANAVEIFSEAKGAFDVVLLDVVMPVMGGREAYERLRALRADVPVVFTTAYSEEQIDVGFVLRENVPVLTKPYDREKLLWALADTLGRRTEGPTQPPG